MHLSVFTYVQVTVLIQFLCEVVCVLVYRNTLEIYLSVFIYYASYSSYLVFGTRVSRLVCAC